MTKKIFVDINSWSKVTEFHFGIISFGDIFFRSSYINHFQQKIAYKNRQKIFIAFVGKSFSTYDKGNEIFYFQNDRYKARTTGFLVGLY